MGGGGDLRGKWMIRRGKIYFECLSPEFLGEVKGRKGVAGEG
jgi:hypothetical protein